MAKTQFSSCHGRPDLGITNVFQDFTLLSVFCSFVCHRGITASIFQVNELALMDAEALGRKDIYMGGFQWNMANHNQGKA